MQDRSNSLSTQATVALSSLKKIVKISLVTSTITIYTLKYDYYQLSSSLASSSFGTDTYLNHLHPRPDGQDPHPFSGTPWQ